MPKAKPRIRYFIYRERPFRPLHLSAGFVEPSDRNAARRHRIWWFRDRALVRKLVHGFHRVEPTSYAEERDYYRLKDGKAPMVRTTKPLPSINDL